MAKVLVIYQGEDAGDLEAIDGALGDAQRLRPGVYLLHSVNVNMRRVAAAAAGIREGRLLWLTVEDDALQSGAGNVVGSRA